MWGRAACVQPPEGWGWGTPSGRGIFPLTRVPAIPQVLKGKLHGSIDVRQSVMSINKKAQRVDLDTEENIYHLKVLGGLQPGPGALGPPHLCPSHPNSPVSHRSSPRSSLPAG